MSQDDVLSWGYQATKDDRREFLKRFLDCVPLEEMRDIQNLIVNQIKRKKSKLSRQGVVPVSSFKVAPVSSSPVAPASTFQAVPASTKCEAQSASSSEAQNKVPDLRWWKKYNENNIVSFDVEMVTTLENVKRPGTVAIIGFDKKIIYEAKIYHPIKSFIVNKHTKRINGFKEDSLTGADCKTFDSVRKEVEKYLDEKLIITSDGLKDFECFDLNMSDYDVFDLGLYFQKISGETKRGDPIWQRIGLRSLYFHFYKLDLHLGVHDAAEDAIAQMEIFHIYINSEKKYCLDVKRRTEHDDNYDYIKTIKDC